MNELTSPHASQEAEFWELRLYVAGQTPRSVAALASPRVSVVSGGLACVAGVGVLARLLPQLRAWRAPTVSVDPS